MKRSVNGTLYVTNPSCHLNKETLFGWNIEIMTAQGSGHTAPLERKIEAANWDGQTDFQ